MAGGGPVRKCHWDCAQNSVIPGLSPPHPRPSPAQIFGPNFRTEREQANAERAERRAKRLKRYHNGVYELESSSSTS